MKKILIIVLVMLMSATCLLSCGKKINTPDHLEIKIYKAGNGTQSIHDVAARFMELYPGKTVEIVENTDPRIVESEIYNGPSLTTTDLYLAGGHFYNISDKGSITFDGVQYENYFESLKDVYDSPAYGETTLIKDKLYDAFKEYYYTQDEVPYYAPWVGSWCGLIYNSKMFEKYGWDVPLTTDQMYEVADKILATNVKSTNKNSLGKDITISPFTYSREDSYWQSVYEQWWVQYDGIDAYYNISQGKNASGKVSYDCIATQGILESMKVMERILGTCEKDKSGNYVLKDKSKCYSDNLLTFRTYTDIQSTFLYGEGARINPTGCTTGAIMPCGGWLENEMSSNFSEEIANGDVAFKAMKTPIVSAIADKTSFKNEQNRDLILREVIKYIDNNKQGEKPAGVTDEDIELIYNARMLMYPQGNHVMIIPAYSTSKDLAKEFIRFLYSDEGCKIFINATKGLELPIKCDYSDIQLSEFQKSNHEIINRKGVVQMLGLEKYPISYTGGISMYNNSNLYGTMEARLAVSNAKDYMTAEEMFKLNVKFTQENWQQSLVNAGII